MNVHEACGWVYNGSYNFIKNEISEPHIIISLCDREQIFAPIVSEKTVITAALWIGDIDVDEDNPSAFNEQRSSVLANMISDVYDSGVRYFRIHCMAGMSRSAGIAAALLRYFGEIEEEKKVWEQKTPQKTMYELFLKSLNEL